MGRINTGGVNKRVGDFTNVANSVTSTTLKLTPPKGFYDGSTGKVTITDADFTETNIRSGVNLFGKIGNIVPLTVVASNDIRASSDGNLSQSGSNLSGVRREIRTEVNGTIRISVDIFADSGEARAHIDKNGSNVVIKSNFLNQWTTYDQDISVVKGDLLQLRTVCGTSESSGTYRNFRMKYIAVTPNSTVLL